eukprot:754803-Hanusia_phi.AAC.2
MQRLRRISLCQTPLVRLPATLGAISTLDEVVVDVDRSIASLSSLRSLNVTGNPLTILPITLGSLNKLEYLEYDGNSVVSPPRDILVKSVQSVVSYLKRAWEGRRTGMLDLSSLALTEIPLEVTDWSPLVEQEVEEQPSVSAEEEASAADVGATADGQVEGPVNEDSAMENVYVIHDDVGRMEKLEMYAADVKDAAFNQGEAADIDHALYVDEDVDRSFEQEDADVVRTDDLNKVQQSLLGHTQAVKDAEDTRACADELASDSESNPEESTETEDLDKCTQDILEDGVAFKTVVSINLESNKVTSLTSDIQKMKCLREISLCNNEIKNFPDSLSTLPNLIRIDASSNLLQSLPPLMGALCSSLKFLHLQNNRFTSFPETLENFSSLVYLSLDSNMLEAVEIKSEFCLNTLKKLHVNSNRISTIHVSENSIASLRTFEANHNLLQDWPDALMQCRKLSELHLDDNKLKAVSSSVGNLRRLKVTSFLPR